MTHPDSQKYLLFFTEKSLLTRCRLSLVDLWNNYTYRQWDIWHNGTSTSLGLWSLGFHIPLIVSLISERNEMV